MRLHGVLLTAGLLATPLCGEQATVRGPVLGLMYDAEARAVRPILGVPGAATLGDASVMDAEVARLTPAPNHRFGLAELTGSDLLHVFQSEAASLAPIAGVPADAAEIVFSPSGRAAVVHYREAGRMLMLAGLPDSPGVSAPVAAPEGVTALAINDDGALLVGISDGEHGAVWAISPSGERRLLFPLREPSAIALLGQRPDAVIADRAANTVYLVRDITGTAEVLPLIAGGGGPRNPVAVAVTEDGRRAVIAGSGGVIAVAGLEDGSFAFASCDCEPLGLERMQGNAVFRLSHASGTPILMLDADSPEPRVVFVPARGDSRP